MIVFIEQSHGNKKVAWAWHNNAANGHIIDTNCPLDI